MRERLRVFHDETMPVLERARREGRLVVDGRRCAPRRGRRGGARRDRRRSAAMIIRKSRRELERMAVAGSIVARTLDMLRREARAGVTTGELDRLAEEFIRAEGGIPTFKGYHGFTGSICSSPNDMIVHGIPGPYELRDGDVISLDVGVTFRGWVADSAITVAVGEVAGEAPPSARDLPPVAVRRDRDVPSRRAPLGHRPRGADARRGRGLRRRPRARRATASAGGCTRTRRCRTTGRPAAARCSPPAWCWRSSR